MGEPTVAVGKVVRAHGVRGEVSVHVLSEVSSRFDPGTILLLEDDGRRLTIESTRRDRGRLLVRFREVSHREAASELRGRYLAVPESEVPGLPEGSWWPHQLEGCVIVTESGRMLGRLVEVVSNPANDLWVARADDGSEVLVPVLGHVIVDVDVAGKRVVVRDIPGLTVASE